MIFHSGLQLYAQKYNANIDSFGEEVWSTAKSSGLKNPLWCFPCYKKTVTVKRVLQIHN